MTEGLLQEPGSARVTGRAPALRPSVPLYRHMLYGSGLTHALDFLVLAHIHFLCEDGQSFTVDELVEALRREGVRSANGKGLIGSKAVYESVARLRSAGFLHRTQENGGNFGAVEYTFYEFPALNPNWTPPGTSVSVQNGPLPLSGEAVPTLPPSNIISAGQTASPDKARADKARADRRSGKRHVSAGQTASPDRRSGKPSPPHPPEEVTTSSPNPLANTSSSTSLPSPREEEGAGYAEEDLRAAADVLQLLPDPWTQGRLNASKLAPKLLKVMAEQGWPGIGTVDRALLTKQLTKNPYKITNPYRLLERDRIPNLPRYVAVAAAAEKSSAGASSDGMCPKHPQYRAGSRCIPCVTA
ncbi:hypothetical protein [Streptomyces vietnamensis]|uniref:hypothetical protein n=1 Tax=Streptomyces vietnamensis TaxID=362257 RepID=UPI00069895ED|nr:hypothetical protein [Streptomyces vietnamensis]